jgi:acyl-CoA reductase-like NAD-dependent aldehyde dehydrogenase
MEIMASYAWLTGTAKLELPEEVMEDNENRRVITRYTPLGVVGAIVPWNFPLHLGIFLSVWHAY